MGSWFDGSLAQRRYSSGVHRLLDAYALERVPVRIDDAALTVGDDAIPRAEVRDARAIPTREGRLFVRVTRDVGPPVDLFVRDRDEASRVLDALGFSTSQFVMTFHGSRPLDTVVPLVLAVCGVMALLGRCGANSPGAHTVTGFTLLFAAFVSTRVLPLMGLRIDVGADGIQITGPWRRQFIPIAKIRSVVEYVESEDRGGLVVGADLGFDDGQGIRVPLGPPSDDAAAFFERVREAMETHRRQAAPELASVLERRRRDVTEWVRDLRVIGTGANATLRTAPIARERLWGILESPASTAEERAAAAVALGSALDEDGARRLRVAADAIVDPRVRVAIRAASGQDEAAIERALLDVSDAETARRASRG